MSVKHLWRGIFAYRFQMEKLYAYAYTKDQARVVMFNRLAKKHGVHPSEVFKMFDGSRDNFSITVEVEMVND